MIQTQTCLKVSDNSGAKTTRCIKIISGYKNRWAVLNSSILVSIIKLKKKKTISSKVKKGQILKGIVIRTKSKTKKKNGNFIKFYENSVVLVSKDSKPIGTRVQGPVSKELRYGKFMKLASISLGFF